MMRKLVSAEGLGEALWPRIRDRRKQAASALPIKSGAREDRHCAVVVARLLAIELADGGLQDAVRVLKHRHGIFDRINRCA